MNRKLRFTPPIRLTIEVLVTRVKNGEGDLVLSANGIRPNDESMGADTFIAAKLRRVSYPFVAVTGCRAAKQALMLLAIEPRLRGALIASPRASDAGTLVRALGFVLPRPTGNFDRSRMDAASDLEGEHGVVELPLNITEDRLLGGLDLERTITTGKRQISTGLLARANQRVLYSNDTNLLDPFAAANLAQALDARYVCVEREGLSAVHFADFMFVGTYNPEEGAPSSLLRDRVGLIVESSEEGTAPERAEVIERVFRFDSDPFKFADAFAYETAQLKSAIDEARACLPRVRISGEQVRQISQIALSLGVEGNRADVFAIKAARSSAALAGRDAVNDDDLASAVRFVLVPRATTLPAPREEAGQRDEPLASDESEDAGRADVEERDRDSPPWAVEDMIPQALDAHVPKDLLSPTRTTLRPSREGKRSRASASTRGRYVRSAIQEGRERRVAIDATLRAAAPFQITRRAQCEMRRRSSDRMAETAFAAGLPHHHVKIEPGDLRFKEFKHRSGILFIFGVDGSGSMAVNRMAQAKGALTRLLQEAYRHRDKVALISFRGDRSDVLLAPTRSVELAKRLVDTLPAGGGTPLSAALVNAIDLARKARLRGTTQAMLVMFTDGRANVSLRGQSAGRAASAIGDELKTLGALLASEEISAVVVDTKSRFVSSGEAEALARIIGARYCYLPRSDSEAIYDAITSNSWRPRGN